MNRVDVAQVKTETVTTVQASSSSTGQVTLAHLRSVVAKADEAGMDDAAPVLIQSPDPSEIPHEYYVAVIAVRQAVKHRPKRSQP